MRQGRHAQALSAARRACKASCRILDACGSPEGSGEVPVGWHPTNGRTQRSRNKWVAVAEMLAVSLHAAAVQHECDALPLLFTRPCFPVPMRLALAFIPLFIDCFDTPVSDLM